MECLFPGRTYRGQVDFARNGDECTPWLYNIQQNWTEMIDGIHMFPDFTFDELGLKCR